MIAGAYTLDLYCDAVERDKDGAIADGIHEWGDLSVRQFVAEHGSACRAAARRAGWRIGRDGAPDLCPKCNPRSRRYVKRAVKKAAPSGGADHE